MGQVWVPEGSICKEIIQAHQNSQIAGHQGKNKTIEIIRQQFNWKCITTDMGNYVKECLVCLQAKPSRLKQTGLLVPLQLAEGLWSSILVDFIVELQISQEYNAVMVVVDRFTKMSHFLSCCTTILSVEMAKLFVDRVFSLHGFPMKIFSD